MFVQFQLSFSAIPIHSLQICSVDVNIRRHFHLCKLFGKTQCAIQSIQHKIKQQYQELNTFITHIPHYYKILPYVFSLNRVDRRCASIKFIFAYVYYYLCMILCRRVFPSKMTCAWTCGLNVSHIPYSVDVCGKPFTRFLRSFNHVV